MANDAINVERPLLQHAMPFMFAVCAAFAVFNILLGLLFSSLPPTGYLLPNWGWSIIFIAVGLSGAYYLLTNHWQATRYVLIAGLLVKATWMFFLILLPRGGTWTLLVWGFIASLQALAVIYFPKLP